MINMKCNTLNSERKTFWSKRQDNECMRCAVLITFFHNSLNLKPDLFIDDLYDTLKKHNIGSNVTCSADDPVLVSISIDISLGLC